MWRTFSNNCHPQLLSINTLHVREGFESGMTLVPHFCFAVLHGGLTLYFGRWIRCHLRSVKCNRALLQGFALCQAPRSSLCNTNLMPSTQHLQEVGAILVPIFLRLKHLMSCQGQQLLHDGVQIKIQVYLTLGPNTDYCNS